jgi:hypothetical protein
LLHLLGLLHELLHVGLSRHEASVRREARLNRLRTVDPVDDLGGQL